MSFAVFRDSISGYLSPSSVTKSHKLLTKPKIQSFCSSGLKSDRRISFVSVINAVGRSSSAKYFLYYSNSAFFCCITAFKSSLATSLSGIFVRNSSTRSSLFLKSFYHSNLPFLASTPVKSMSIPVVLTALEEKLACLTKVK